MIESPHVPPPPTSPAVKEMPTPKQRPVSDLSPRVVGLARMIDRLPPAGAYMIRLIKTDSEHQRWLIEISSFENLQKAEI